MGLLIIDTVFDWFIHKILEKYFGKYFSKESENSELLEMYKKRMKELEDKNDVKTVYEKSIEDSEQEIDRLLHSIKNRGISLDKLIKDYNKPVNAILISYATQKIDVEKKNQEGTYTKESHFIREELERYDNRYLGGTTQLIPPKNTEEILKKYDSPLEWFDKEILKGRYCKLKFLTIIDLKDSYWGTYLPYRQKSPKHRSIGEVLDAKDILTNKEIIRKIALSEIIKNGDLLWLSSLVLDPKDIDIIHENQLEIEEKINNPGLKALSKGNIINKLAKVLKEFNVSNPRNSAELIVKEAKFWNSKLDG